MGFPGYTKQFLKNVTPMELATDTGYYVVLEAEEMKRDAA